MNYYQHENNYYYNNFYNNEYYNHGYYNNGLNNNIKNKSIFFGRNKLFPKNTNCNKILYEIKEFKNDKLYNVKNYTFYNEDVIPNNDFNISNIDLYNNIVANSEDLCKGVYKEYIDYKLNKFNDDNSKVYIIVSMKDTKDTINEDNFKDLICGFMILIDKQPSLEKTTNRKPKGVLYLSLICCIEGLGKTFLEYANKLGQLLNKKNIELDSLETAIGFYLSCHFNLKPTRGNALPFIFLLGQDEDDDEDEDEDEDEENDDNKEENNYEEENNYDDNNIDFDVSLLKESNRGKIINVNDNNYVIIKDIDNEYKFLYLKKSYIIFNEKYIPTEIRTHLIHNNFIDREEIRNGVITYLKNCQLDNKRNLVNTIKADGIIMTREIDYQNYLLNTSSIRIGSNNIRRTSLRRKK